MQRNLLVMAYAYEDEVFTQLFYAPSYDFPEIYTGEATMVCLDCLVVLCCVRHLTAMSPSDPNHFQRQLDAFQRRVPLPGLLGLGSRR